ncbi:DUF1365-domain-containing protein [Basidiobolus meristosporus CBS 931.73]|uniref:DUF1365-domain-containing protein n=1 Tax=Basidiobolus meristosporus CBS 931.73 TaxID=1314790 RepID=A0A1Y1ZBL6_9FUNG|nr:DUF1365-domain-containing protein [Basidiobolus meristosporus CBS 931.73]|eukprot:ORY07713.1 DUF1365-domain-containing protein [Basidiobolus meristosporus CBS 931.73]
MPLPKTHTVYLGKTYHARFLPSKHSFAYDVFYFGVNLDLLEEDSQSHSSWGNLLFGYNRRSIYSLWYKDYLGDVPVKEGRHFTLKRKLLYRLHERGISTERIQSIELVTTPRFLGYAFNPLSIYYCYCCEIDGTKQLQIVVLEVSNTFGEKHLYILDNSKAMEKPRKGYDATFKIHRSFHVSPFNDRNGSYEIHLRDPQFGYHDIKIIVYANADEDSSLKATHGYQTQEIKKLVAILNGKQYPLTSFTLCCILVRYPITAFLTFPRILYEAALLAYRKCLKIYPRPDPVEETIVKQQATFLER